MSTYDWCLLKNERRQRRAVRTWDERITQELKVGGAKLISSYTPSGELVYRRCSTPCSFDRPGTWPKVFKPRKTEE